jgi:hypothetical protein
MEKESAMIGLLIATATIFLGALLAAAYLIWVASQPAASALRELDAIQNQATNFQDIYSETSQHKAIQPSYSSEFTKERLRSDNEH